MMVEDEHLELLVLISSVLRELRELASIDAVGETLETTFISGKGFTSQLTASVNLSQSSRLVC
jgi:hypothetical protein